MNTYPHLFEDEKTRLHTVKDEIERYLLTHVTHGVIPAKAGIHLLLKRHTMENGPR